MNLCYKVYKKTVSGKMKSVSPHFSSIYSLHYEVGKVTRPNIGRLFVFNTAERAAEFKKHHSFAGVLLCECGELESQRSRLCIGYWNSRNVRGFWGFGGKGLRGADLWAVTTVPSGTLSTDWVKPIQEVEEG